MGASVPSTSQSTAAEAESERRGAISSAIRGATACEAVTVAVRWRPSRPLVSPPVARDRLLRLVAIATAAGAFSGLLGVGGGTVIVPLLILWLGYGEREATGTSLAAIVIIAAYATVGQALYGNVDVAKGALIAVPALGGVVAGTALQQRLPERAVALLFAALLIATAIDLIVS
jgi:uncharacterized membrane protein YfcA